MVLTILTIGILFTLGMPITKILRRKKDYVIYTDDFSSIKLWVTIQTNTNEGLWLKSYKTKFNTRKLWVKILGF